MAEFAEIVTICRSLGMPEVVINKKLYTASHISEMCELVREALSRYQEDAHASFNMINWIQSSLSPAEFDKLTHALVAQAGDDHESEAWELLKDLTRGPYKPLLDWGNLRAHAVIEASCKGVDRERAPMDVRLIISPDYAEKFAEIVMNNPE